MEPSQLDTGRIGVPSWTGDYPDPEVLRREVQAMVQAISDALLAKIPSDEITGIYFKGSANKHWDSPLDYVPQLSDVDIHVQFHDDAAVERRLGTMEAALDICAEMERGFFARVDSPIHTPLPQLIVLNHLLAQDDYFPSPHHTVVTLFGQPYPDDPLDDEPAIRRAESQHLLEHADSLASWPLRAVDKPGPYMRSFVKGLSWRVAPTAARVLCLDGVPAMQAWSMNRTQIVDRLCELGRDALADAYTRYYLSAWQCFLSAYADSAAARTAASAGVAVLQQGVDIARAAAEQQGVRG